MPTPMRKVRVSDDLWTASLEEAARRGETVSEVINRALSRYTKTPYRRDRKRRGAVRGLQISREAAERRAAS